MCKSLQLLMWTLSAGLLLACVSTHDSPPIQSKPIVQTSTPTSSSADVAPVSTTGTSADRAAVESSNKQIYDAQHGMSSPTQPTTAPTTGIPQ